MLKRQMTAGVVGLVLLSGAIGCGPKKPLIDPNTVARIESAAGKADAAATRAESAARSAADAAAKADAAASKAAAGFKPHK